MSDKWDGLLEGELPEPVPPRPRRESLTIPWARVFALLALGAIIALVVWRAVGYSTRPAPADAPTVPSAQSAPSQAPTPSADAPASASAAQSAAGAHMFEPAQRVASAYAHAFYERSEGEDWSTVAHCIARTATTPWAVELTNSLDLQDAGLAVQARITDVQVSDEVTDPENPTQWSATLTLTIDEDGATSQRRAHTWAEVVPGVGWRISRWEEEPGE